jgi:hypothetical protein
MSGIVITSPPLVEPLSLAEVKVQLGYGPWEDSDHVTSANIATRLRDLIKAARGYCETFTRRTFIATGFQQVMDSFPYFTDTFMSQQAYPPAYYSLPRYSTTLWNYSQMIKLYRPPLIGVTNIQYVDAITGELQTLLPGTPANQQGAFVVDNENEPARLFPNSGQNWPACLYVPNAVQINFTAGYGTSAGSVPPEIKVAMRMLVKLWDRDETQIGKPCEWVDRLLWSLRCEDWASTRG